MACEFPNFRLLYHAGKKKENLLLLFVYIPANKCCDLFVDDLTPGLKIHKYVCLKNVSSRAGQVGSLHDLKYYKNRKYSNNNYSYIVESDERHNVCILVCGVSVCGGMVEVYVEGGVVGFNAVLWGYDKWFRRCIPVKILKMNLFTLRQPHKILKCIFSKYFLFISRFKSNGVWLFNFSFVTSCRRKITRIFHWIFFPANKCDYSEIFFLGVFKVWLIETSKHSTPRIFPHKNVTTRRYFRTFLDALTSCQMGFRCLFWPKSRKSDFFFVYR